MSSPSDLDLPVLLTPDHIRRREFVTTRRGYDPDQVRDYLEQIAEQVERMGSLLREARLEAETALRAQAAPRADPYEQFGRRVADVLRSADQEAERVRREAGEEAERVLREARADADRVRLDAQARAEEAREAAERTLREARERADRTIAGLSTRRDELVDQLATMQERLVGVARDLEAAIERRDDIVDVEAAGSKEEGKPAPFRDVWAGWAPITDRVNEMAAEPEQVPADREQTPEPPPGPRTDELFSSTETVDLTFPEIPPLDLGWDEEDE